MGARRIFFAVAASMLILSGAACAEDTEMPSGQQDEKRRFLYQWTDENGVVHITDDLGHVPEKFRGRAKRSELLPEKEGIAPVSEREADQYQPEIENGQRLKAEWRQRFKDARSRLEKVEARRSQLQKEKADLFAAWGSSALAPIANRQRAEEIDSELEEVQREIEEARRYLETTLPDEARRAGIPPGWLRE